MNIAIEQKPNSQPIYDSSDSDCLLDLIGQAENAQGGMDENPDLNVAMERHILLDTENEVELMCRRCPVQCTAQLIGGSALLLVHNREACIDSPE